MEKLKALWANKIFRTVVVTVILAELPDIVQDLTQVHNPWADRAGHFLATLYAILKASPLASEALTDVLNKKKVE